MMVKFVRLVPIETCKSCTFCKPDFMYLRCDRTGYQLESKPDENKQAYYPIPDWCPLEEVAIVTGGRIE